MDFARRYTKAGNNYLRAIDAMGEHATDLGVTYKGVPFVRVAENPQPGQYATVSGVYVFNIKDRRKRLVITGSVRRE